MDSTIEIKLGFDVIRRMIADECYGSPGRSLTEFIQFSDDYDKIKKQLFLAGDFHKVSISGSPLPISEYDDRKAELQRAKTEGTYIETDILVSIRSTFGIINACINFLKNLHPSDYPFLSLMVINAFPEETVIREINRIVDDKGEIYDSASPSLAKIRKEIKSRIVIADRKIAQILKQAKDQKIINPDSEISVRNGKLVIPVPAANKRKLKGVIHDESATGSTVYIEPSEVLELNNHIRELELAEQREIIRILIALTDTIRPRLTNMLALYQLFAEIDKMHAISRFSNKISATVPLYSNTRNFSWLQARHPLLLIAHQKQGKTVVPLDIQITSENRVLIISGPNAGGKSVCLKTIGLLQYMLQCGLPVPMRETSETGHFRSIFIDIGDQQSIENDLSTYSSHLLNIKSLISEADNKTLFLIDEFGSGTEPQSGGAIAEAVLEELNTKSAYGIVTTHYANLKLLARKGNGFVNGAMLFDTKNLKPLYQLKIGNPGSSFAFEIARSIDFPGNVLDHAAGKLGHQQLDFDRQIQEMESEKLDLERKEKQLRLADESLADTLQKYASLVDTIEKQKKEILEKARQDARNILADTNKMIEKTIREIREAQAEKQVTLKARKELQEFSDAVFQKIEEVKPDEMIPAVPEPPVIERSEATLATLKAGDQVVMKGQDEIGEVESIAGGQVMVAFKKLRMKVAADKLELVKSKSSSAQKSFNIRRNNIINDLNAKLANFRLTIDIRGYRAEEALNAIQKYMDEALMLHVPEIQILHGKGNGVLRQVIRDYLKTIQQVRGFSDAPLDQGGAGITIVSLH